MHSLRIKNHDQSHSEQQASRFMISTQDETNQTISYQYEYDVFTIGLNRMCPPSSPEKHSIDGSWMLSEQSLLCCNIKTVATHVSTIFAYNFSVKVISSISSVAYYTLRRSISLQQ